MGGAVEAVVDLTGVATFDAAFDLAGAATFDAAFEFAGAATFDVAVVFEVAVAVVFEAVVEVDLPRHGALPNFLAIIRVEKPTRCAQTCFPPIPNND